MSKKLLLLLVAISLVGLADASYITYQKINHIIPPCSAQFACETVLSSKWSAIGPIPLSLLGCFFYATVLTLSISLFLSHTTIHTRLRFNPAIILMIVGISGLAFSAGLLGIMGIVLKAWCLYCLISAACSMSIGGLSIGYWVTTRKARYEH
jgi:uncharacterized membrane protein